jgi:hypothetical protein
MPDISTWQMGAVALCEHACGFTQGRSKDDPVYLEVVEHRDVPPNRSVYSSCGDLGHWLLERLGLREGWVNRASLGHYVIGANVARLGLGCPISHPPPTDPNWAPGPGDICEIWNTGIDAHVFVSLGVDQAGTLRTANYGAGGMNASAWPGANIAESPFVRSGSGWMVGKAHPRKLQRIIRLEDAVALVKARADLSGARVTDDLIDALGAKWTGDPDAPIGG